MWETMVGDMWETPTPSELGTDADHLQQMYMSAGKNLAIKSYRALGEATSHVACARTARANGTKHCIPLGCPWFLIASMEFRHAEASAGMRATPLTGISLTGIYIFM